MSIDASFTRSGPIDGAPGLRGSGRHSWEGAAPSSRTQSQSLSFWDLLDIINPLHHLPLIGPIYRHVSGDELNSTARILGGTLYGGPVGLVSGVADAVVHQQTGDYVGGHMMTAMLGDGAVQGDPAPAGDADPYLALGPLVGQQVAAVGGAGPPANAAKSLRSAPLGTPGAAGPPAADGGVTVIVQRDGTILRVAEPPPPAAAPESARQYQRAAQINR